MTKYIKQEMVDLSGKGEEKVYYRIQTQRNIGFKELTEYIERHNNLMNRGLVKNVVDHVVDAMAELIGDGYSVTIDGLGTFKASLGLEKDKEMDTLEGIEPKRNSRSLQLNGVNFRADKELIKKARKDCKLHREGIAQIHRSPYSKEERLTLALKYLKQHGAMKVADYMEFTGLSRTVATLELQDFRRDPSSGIDFIGRGSAKVYVRKL